MKRSQFLPIFFIALFAIACYFPLFLHLDHMSVRLWDEARRAVNAFEMTQNGNLLVTHYDGAPEMWGTKPPLLIWCQAFFMNLIGYNEVALRLPSALAALAAVLLLVLFSWKVLKRPLTGFLAGLVLLTTKGYVGAHVARSGDFDSLLTLWETSYLLVFFTFFCQTDFTKKRKWLYLTAAFVALAGLTKGIAGFLFLPGILIFYVAIGGASGEIEGERWDILKMLKWRHTWLAALVAIVPVASFYLLREAANPGYLAAVMDNEVGGRYLETQGGHNHPWYHYFEWLWREQFQPWLLFIPLGLVVGFWQKGRLRSLTWLLLLNSLAFLSIISFAQTRIMWYMAPVYPSLALVVGIGFEKLVTGASQALRPAPINQSPVINYLLLATFAAAIFYQPYRATVERVYFEQHPPWDWHELKYRDFMRRVKDVKNYTIVHAKYNSHVVFYSKIYNLEGYGIRHQPLTDFDLNKFEFGRGPLEFGPGDTLMVCEKPVFAALDTVYRYEVLRDWESCKLLKINGEVKNE